MLRHIGCVVMFICLPSASLAQDDDLIHLPGQGEIKTDAVGYVSDIGRLIPGGGLLLSFDADRDGNITEDEINTGIDEAFLAADANEDGRMTPLEQRKWASTLPSHDESLKNPARFDPNLDRVVRTTEFRDIITDFAALHMDETTGSIPVVALRSRQRGRVPQEELELAPDRPLEPVEEETDQRARRSARGS